MKKKLSGYAIGAAIITVISAVIIFNFEKSIIVGNTLVTVKRVDTLEEMQVGLLKHKSLAENSGMLFIFRDEDIYPFHMVGMQFPIDFIWIDSNGKVVDITPDAQPQIENSNDARTYYSTRPIKYVLEVNAGWAKSHGISTGMLVRRIK